MAIKKKVTSENGNEFELQFHIHYLNMDYAWGSSKIKIESIASYDRCQFYNTQNELPADATSTMIEAIYVLVERDSIRAFNRIIEKPFSDLMQPTQVTADETATA
jgi:hypothetical protein